MPTFQETDAHVAHARRVLAEMTARAVEDTREAEQHRSQELNDWHAQDHAGQRDDGQDYGDGY
ncbi:hypothetical protein [Pseudonocardia humida]|uniref:Uncharacterized protein n=1 Tax=Pseudonocardia humida TaxID=2800819 RepID=A0ABT1A538_9PSEU|nr:hypothetical protein [Pseudonocardia humida]MCO1657874.1 hypothetical protein [Pseudonocardia humida]